jgi:hypothetical protein
MKSDIKVIFLMFLQFGDFLVLLFVDANGGGCDVSPAEFKFILVNTILFVVDEFVFFLFFGQSVFNFDLL